MYTRKLDDELDVMYRFRFYAPNFESYPHNFGEEHVDFGGLTQQGNYVLSKHKFTKAEQIFYHRNYSQLREDDWKNVLIDWMPCSLQIVQISSEDKHVKLLNNHGRWTKERSGDAKSLSEVQNIIDQVKDCKTPWIITGDFNLTTDSEAFKLLKSEMKELVTENNFKTTLRDKDLVIDYIFVSKDINVKEFRLLDTKVSDHYPLVIEFDLV
jgi:endonuclease/exonuclease/phosphatase family metal-dependent hydrolase